jgi:hypothetical protein
MFRFFVFAVGLISLSAIDARAGAVPPINLIDLGERELTAGTIIQQLSASNPPQAWFSLTQIRGPLVAI